MHDRLTALDAPVTVNEIRAATGKDRDGIRKRARREQWERPGGMYAFTLAKLPDDIREPVARLRNRMIEESAQVHAADARAVVRHDKLPCDYSEKENLLAKAKAAYVIAVERLRKSRPFLHYRDCVRATVLTGDRQHESWYLALIAVEQKNGRSKNLIALGENPNGYSFPAYENFIVWKGQWAKYRRHSLDDYQYWALCDNRHHGAKLRASGYEREGCAEFWAVFRHRYECTARPGIEECYRDTRKIAVANGWTDLPTAKQVRYYYENKLSDADKRLVEKRREGRKYHYDKLDIYILRDWHRVFPDDCWSFDGHLLDVWCRRWDPSRQGWVPDRPWLVNAIDSCSWFEVGSHFTWVPGADSVEYVIRNAFWRGQRVAILFYFDNGREFKAAGRKLVMDEKRLNEVCDNLRVESMYALPYNPRAKVNERDYRNVVRWFEAKQPTYLGNAAINKSNFDQRWHDMHKPGQPLERDGRGCLVNWHLVPELDDIQALYKRYREADHHQRVRTGRICPNQSPAEKYLSARPARLLTDEEIAWSFLRDVGPQTVTEQPRIWVLPPRCVKGEELWFEDEALMEYRGRQVVVKIDTAESEEGILAYAFQDCGQGDLRMIKCGGAHNSVPRMGLLHPFKASQEEIRTVKRNHARMQRTKRTGDKAGRFLQAERELSEEVARDLGVTPGQARTYVIRQDAIAKRAEGIQADDAELAAARKKLDPKLAHEYRYGQEAS